MHDSKKLDLIEDPNAASLAAAMTPWAPWASWAPRSPGGATVAGWLRRLVKDIVRPYRPELHYMRGPGPKWRAKHRKGGAR